MIYIYPAGSPLHSQSTPHRAFVIVELYQPESYHHLLALLMLFSSHIPPSDHLFQHLQQSSRKQIGWFKWPPKKKIETTTSKREMRSKPLIESAATVENMDLINSTPGLANLLISPLRRNMLSERDVKPHMIKAFCCLNNLVACECLSAWSWAKRRSWRSDWTTDLIFHYVSYLSTF